MYYSANLPKTLAGAKRETTPGTTWRYKDTDAELLGWVLSRATGQTVSAVPWCTDAGVCQPIPECR